MLGKFVARVMLIHRDHDTVAGDFGEDAGCGNAETETISAYQRSLRDREGVHRETVDQDVIG